jgi:ataxia telangiectasia mutated family protein
MSTARLDTAARTEAEYFTPAVALLGGLPSAKEHGLVFHRFAIFAESQFRTLEKSPEIQRLRLYNDRQRQELSYLVQANGKPRPNLPRDSTGSSRFDKVTRLQQDDADKIRAHEETVQALLRTAIDMFGRALASSDDFDDALLRLASLWMSHHAREDLHANVKATIGAIPSHKFVRIVIQLSARLEDTATQFQAILHAVFERLVAEHPFHCLYQLLTARGFGLSQRKEGDRRRSSSVRGSASSAKARDDGPRTSRSFAAEKILAKVAKRSATAAGRIRDVDLFCVAAIEWAWLPPEQPKVAPGTRKAAPLVMDKTLKLAQIRHLAIPIPTAPLAIDLTCKYRANAMVTIKGFAREWVRAGGIHVPKITTCVGDDGRSYKQLVRPSAHLPACLPAGPAGTDLALFQYKSDDDIRQDAVMEQLFGITNDLLARDPKTRSRHLHMLTYKVVPLGDLTGFIEFVTDTLPIDSFLRRSHQK